MRARTIWVASTAAALIACGGDGGDGVSAGQGGPGPGGGGAPAPIDERPGGLWTGTATNDQLGGSQQLIGISTDDGRFRFLSLDTAGQFIGSIVVNGAMITGVGTGYAALGTTWIDGSVATGLSIAGTLDERRSLSGDWETATGESGTFSFAYEPLFERDSSLALLADTWTGFDDFGNPVATFTIDSGGRFDGQDVDGCLYSGQVSVVDASVNVYELALMVTNCGAASGDYTGLGFLGDDVGTNDVFVYSIDSNSFAFIGVVLR